MIHKCPGRAPRSSASHRGRESGTHTTDDCREAEGGEFPCVGQWGFVGGSCAWWVCVGRTGRKRRCTGRWMKELKRAAVFLGQLLSIHWLIHPHTARPAGLHSHSRTHGKQRLAFLWRKVQFNVYNTFFFLQSLSEWKVRSFQQCSHGFWKHTQFIYKDWTKNIWTATQFSLILPLNPAQ